MNPVIILIFVVFVLMISSPIKKNKSETPVTFDYLKNAAEIKTKVWYDPRTKTDLAAMSVVTKRYVKKLWKIEVVEMPQWNIDCNNLEFQLPLKLANGELIFSTAQLPYRIK